MGLLSEAIPKKIRSLSWFPDEREAAKTLSTVGVAPGVFEWGMRIQASSLTRFRKIRG
jgi:hypothetical protein